MVSVSNIGFRSLAAFAISSLVFLFSVAAFAQDAGADLEDEEDDGIARVVLLGVPGGGTKMLTKKVEAIDETVIKCDIGDLLNLPFNVLSIGQQQRVLLARAIVQSAGEGKIILLDEPTSAMDLHHVHTSMQILKDLATTYNTAIIIVMQDLNLVARYADTAWLLNKGSLVARGDWATVLTPSILEPVYNVRIRMMRRTSDKKKSPPRPIFDVDLPSDTPS